MRVRVYLEPGKLGFYDEVLEGFGEDGGSVGGGQRAVLLSWEQVQGDASVLRGCGRMIPGPGECSDGGRDNNLPDG